MTTDAADAPEALYLPDGPLLVPTIATRGPWTPDAQHGGPVAALICRAAEAEDAAAPMAVARLTVELLRPVPLTPLTVTRRLRRPGRRVQLIDVDVHAGDVLVASGTVLRIRVAAPDVAAAAVPAPGRSPGGDTVPPPPESTPQPFVDVRFPWLNTLGMDVRFVAGSFDTPGPAAAWFRMRMPLVAGEQPSGTQRAAVAADSGSGVGAALPFGPYLFLNPEITMHISRPPVGEWICVDAGTVLGTAGAGVALTQLWDADGVVGSAAAALMVDAAPG